MSNFTPGPWKASGRYDAPRVFSHADDDNPQFVAEIAVRSAWEANANLIAAAPEMYEALKALVEATGPAHIELSSVKAVRQMGHLLEATKQANAALTKADGAQ